MAVNSKIQWTDVTWNPATGCTKVDADCLYCYMYRQSLNGTRYEPKEVIRTKKVFTLPLRIKEPSRIFTASLTDIFHEDIDSYRHEIWDIIRRCPQHTFQILTKRPERIMTNLPPDWGEGWKNVWMGTSVGSPAGYQRMIDLAQSDAKVKFLSIEPLHAGVDLAIPKIYTPEIQAKLFVLPAYDWIIVGGESGNENGKYRYRECKIEWIENIVARAKLDQIPVFVKQLGTHLAKQYKLKDRHGGDWDEWPAELEHLKIRQFPK